MASMFKIPIHQYHCYNPIVPGCPGDPARFHAECVGPERATLAGQPFDTFARHLEINGDIGKRLVVKMDVEGSEWLSLAGAPDHVLNAIDQMAVEFHEVESRVVPRHHPAVERVFLRRPRAPEQLSLSAGIRSVSGTSLRGAARQQAHRRCRSVGQRARPLAARCAECAWRAGLPGVARRNELQRMAAGRAAALARVDE